MSRRRMMMTGAGGEGLPVIQCEYNVTSTTASTKVLGDSCDLNQISRMWIDGVEITPTKVYKFSNPGKHTVDVLMVDVNAIPRTMFASCGMRSLTIPDIVTSIDSYAFQYCNGLGSLTIPNGVTSIKSYTFDNCFSIESLTIHDNVTSIEEYAFNRCYGLTNIEVMPGNTVYDSRNGCNAIIKTSNNQLVLACKGSSIPNSVKSIGSYAFASGGLRSIIIPNGVTSIKSYAFQGSDLRNVTFSESVKSLASYAFYGFSRTESLTFLGTTPPTLGKISLGATNDCPIYVPASSVDAYKAASGWSDYADRIQAISE